MSKQEKNARKRTLDNAHDPLSWLMSTGEGCESKAGSEKSSNEIEQDVCEIQDAERSAENNASIQLVENISDENNDDGTGNEAMPDTVLKVEEKEEADSSCDIEAETMAEETELLVLEEDVSIIHVARLKEEWMVYIDSLKNVTIDAEKVEDIDTAGLQLLLSFIKTVKGSGREVFWKSPSDTIVEAATETALKDVMGIRL